jgi:RNA recognition motif-containing protein
MKKSYQEVKNSIIMENKNLFVGNLGSNITEDELREQFSYFGRVRFIRLIKEKGIAFVRMVSAEDVYNARLGLNGIQLNGQRIRVMEARPKK